MTSIFAELFGLKKAKRVYFVLLYIFVFFILFYPTKIFTYELSGVEAVWRYPIALFLFVLAWDLQRNNI